MTDQELPWLKMMLMLGILAALFAFPIISISMDERRKRRARASKSD
ncbi:hypothetical protein ACSMXN_08560 [Jatrophihabitans sp. DSM 45814]